MTLMPTTMTPNTGSFQGYASIFGVADESGDTVIRGAFTGGLDYFQSSRVVLWNHDMSRPVALATAIVEDGIGLWTSATFLGTPDGQMARQVVTEAKTAGAPYGLSFGYAIREPRGVTTAPGGGRFLRRLTLLEVSLVSLPMNRLARVRAVKFSDAQVTRLQDHLVAITREHARSLGVRL